MGDNHRDGDLETFAHTMRKHQLIELFAHGTLHLRRLSQDRR